MWKGIENADGFRNCKGGQNVVEALTNYNQNNMANMMRALPLIVACIIWISINSSLFEDSFPPPHHHVSQNLSIIYHFKQ